MFKKISDWIKNLFSKKEEMDPHEELLLHVPEPEIGRNNYTHIFIICTLRSLVCFFGGGGGRLED